MSGSNRLLLVYFCLLALSFVRPTFVEDNDVLVLSKNDFDQAKKQFQHLFVEFYAPWCGHCKSIAPEFNKAAQILKEQGSEIRFAVVDGTAETELGSQYNVSGYPTFKFFMGDKNRILDYADGRHASDFVSYVSRKTGPPARIINDVEAAKEFVNSSDFVLFGFFKNQDYRKVFDEFVFDHDKYLAAVTDDDKLFKEFDLHEDTIVAFKKYDELKAELQKDFSLQSIKTFVAYHHLPLVNEFVEENAVRIFSTDVQLYNILLIARSHESFQQNYDEFHSAALKFKGKVIFIFADLDEQDNHKVREFIGVSAEECPTYRLVDLSVGEPIKYKPTSGMVSKALIESFVGEVLSGSAKPFFKSKELPSDWDSRPVKVLVGSNFQNFVDSTKKNVAVLFYVPWCGICKRLDPVWEQIGEKYQNSNKVVIAKFDCSENELENRAVNSFPTINLFLKGSNEVVDYNGLRTFDALVRFIESDGREIVVPDELRSAEELAKDVKDEL